MSRYDMLLPRAGPRSLVDPIGPRPAPATEQTPGKVRFEDILEGKLGGGNVKVSGHAQERARIRGIPLGQIELDRIGQAMDQVARKGGREALVIGPDAAFVVSVPNRTVITAMARDELKDNVFTQIDSAVIVD
jgi:flagellar operon protein